MFVGLAGIIYCDTLLAERRRQMADNKKPAYVIRQKSESGVWTSIGAVWNLKDKEGFSVRLNMVPTNWDGSAIMIPPREDEE